VIDIGPGLRRQGVRLRRARVQLGLLFVSAVVGALIVVPGAGGVANDPTPPAINLTIFGTLGTNGWYTSTVTLNWSVVDPESTITSTSGCDAITFATDTPGISRTCTATSDGGTTAMTKPIKLDKTAPVPSGAAARGPDSNGWYNHAVTVSFSGTDATSGVHSCSSVGYGGPDNPGAVVTGSCRDHAGNVATAGYSLKYDATPPTVTALRTRAGKHTAEVSWQASADTKLVEVTRAPGVRGAPFSVIWSGTASAFRDAGLEAARKYTYQVAVVDEAANRSGARVAHVGTGALLRPAPGERVSAPPLLTWAPVKGARYYHVQLLRGTRVLLAWPTTTSLQLRRTWVANGRRYRLRPGIYRWYVWPGLGRIAANQYGARLGGSTFVVTG
jgi:hypothetical protein